jgi:3-deoxy-7-phosphoheptulonate synthase
MIIIMERGATEEQVEGVIERLVELGFTVHRSTGAVHTVLGGVGPNEEIDPEEFEILPGVKECRRVIAPFKLASRAFRPEGSVVDIGGVKFGADAVVLLAGPGNVENEAQIERAAEMAARAGAKLLRAGAYKQRINPYVFQGLNEQALAQLRRAAERYGLRTASEIVEPAQIAMMEQHVDLLIVGARHMQHYTLLSALGRQARPVMLKRASGATVEELLTSAEYIVSGGNYNVILCERGIRTFETSGPATLDVAAIPTVKRLSHLPIIVDPSRAAGRRDKVTPLALAAVAAGADGVMVDAHPDADASLVEGAQTLGPQQLEELAAQLKAVAAAVGRSL